MEIDRIQLNEDGSMQPTLQGYVSKVQQPLKGFQDLVDNRQEIIDSSDSTFLKNAAQPVQDIQNIIAHPIQTGKTMIDEAVAHPYQTAFGLTPIGVSYNIGKSIVPQQNETLGDWGQRIAGQVAGNAPLMALALGTGGAKIPTVGGAIENIAYKPNIPSIRNGIAREAIKVNKSVPVKETANQPSFTEHLMVKSGADPNKAGFYDNQKIIHDNTKVKDSAAGGYNPKMNEIYVGDKASKTTVPHEKAHRMLKIFDALERADQNSPEMSKFMYDLRQSQSDRLTPLYKNEAISRAFQVIEDPTIKFNPQTLESIGVNLKDIDNAVKVIQPYYQEYLGGLK